MSGGVCINCSGRTGSPAMWIVVAVAVVMAAVCLGSYFCSPEQPEEALPKEGKTAKVSPTDKEDAVEEAKATLDMARGMQDAQMLATHPQAQAAIAQASDIISEGTETLVQELDGEIVEEGANEV